MSVGRPWSKGSRRVGTTDMFGPPMKCRGCGQEVYRVRVWSRCWQEGTVEGNRVVDYDSIEEIAETIAVECFECLTDLTDDVECT
jgi:hypothetical protein